MKTHLCLLFALAFIVENSSCQENKLKTSYSAIDYVKSFKDTLASLSETSGDAYFRMNCNSILSVTNSIGVLSPVDSTYLKNMFTTFISAGDPSGVINMSVYQQRKRPMIISWVSPTDGAVSFSWLTLPKDWNPQNKYPLYIQLHGLWSVAANPIEYMTYPYRQGPSSSMSFEDGYLLSPWGRGNYWYLGISETDILEAMAALENIAVIDPARKYMSGHSMGGYGAWSIVSKSPDTWAAMGIMAGALWHYPDVLNEYTVHSLKDIPTYFVCGTSDGLLEINQTAFELLQDEGNWHLQFITFNGGHEYLELNAKNMYLWMRQYVKRELTDIVQPGATTNSGLRIACYPNPANTWTNIVCSGDPQLVADIAVYDIYGRIVDDVASGFRLSGGQTIPYDASGLKPGIYVVRVNSEGQWAESKMVLIR